MTIFTRLKCLGYFGGVGRLVFCDGNLGVGAEIVFV